MDYTLYHFSRDTLSGHSNKDILFNEKCEQKNSQYPFPASLSCKSFKTQQKSCEKVLDTEDFLHFGTTV